MWNKWADNWLSGKDRTATSVRMTRDILLGVDLYDTMPTSIIYIMDITNFPFFSKVCCHDYACHSIALSSKQLTDGTLISFAKKALQYA